MKRGVALALFLAALAPAARGGVEVDADVLSAEADRVQVLARARAATLAIFSNGGQGGGSGVLISADGFALSNFHVTAGCGAAMKCGLSDGNLYDAVIVGLDPTGDVALIKLFGREDFPYAELADSDQVRPGDWAFAVGNPFLLANDFQPTVSYGIVSGTHRYQYPAGTILEYADCIQVDAAINPGNSGGPLFNAAGELIGINGRGSFEKRGRVSVGVGYAISINQIKNFLGCLKAGRVVDHATLGARVSGDEQGRVTVSDILDDSDAYRRGLRYGDEIVRFAGRPIRTANAFKNVLGIFPRDWSVPLTFRRGTSTREVLVRLAGVHHSGELDKILQGPAPRPPGQDPEPQPEDAPAPQPGEEPQDPQPKPKPLDPRQQRAAPAMPEIVRDHYEARPGYANYYFNKLGQERIWSGLVARGGFAGAGQWMIESELEGGGQVRFQIGAEQVVGSFPNGEAALLVSDDLSTNLDPPGSGGLLAALHLWRRLLVEGLAGYGQVYYFGTLPALGQDGPVEVLVGVHGGVECRFLVHPAEGHLLGLELFTDGAADPCEVYFSDYAEVEGRFVPSRMTVRHGDGLYGVFTINQFACQDAGEI